jgi:hypothetical protein
MGRFIDRVPPTAGAPTTKLTSDGRTEDWCSTCGQWGNHNDDGHEQFRARFGKYARQNKTGKANNVTTKLSDQTQSPPIYNYNRDSASEIDPDYKIYNESNVPGQAVSDLVTVLADNTSARLRIPSLPTTNFTMGHF